MSLKRRVSRLEAKHDGAYSEAYRAMMEKLNAARAEREAFQALCESLPLPEHDGGIAGMLKAYRERAREARLIRHE